MLSFTAEYSVITLLYLQNRHARMIAKHIADAVKLIAKSIGTNERQLEQGTPFPPLCFPPLRNSARLCVQTVCCAGQQRRAELRRGGKHGGGDDVRVERKNIAFDKWM